MTEARATIQVRPGYSFGLPTFASGTRVDVVVERITAGDDDASILADFDGLTADEVAIAHALDGALFEEDEDEPASSLTALADAAISVLAVIGAVIVVVLLGVLLNTGFHAVTRLLGVAS